MNTRLITCLVVCAALLCGCGDASSPVAGPINRPALSFARGCLEAGTRRPLYAGIVAIDTASGKVTVLDGREYQAHWDVTRMLSPPRCAECIGIRVLDFQPDSDFIKLEVTLTNPTSLTGCDVRGIMLTNLDGFRLVNADGYTDLWDDGGDITLNPFKAYAVDQPQREFAGHAKHSRIYAIRYPSAPELLTLELVVDASWPDNCEEPYFLGNYTQTAALTNDGNATDVEVTVRDWQSDVSVVTLDLAPIGGGVTHLVPTSGPKWGGSIAAAPGTEPGLHMIEASAQSAGSDLVLCNLLPVIVEPVPGTPTKGPVWTSTVAMPSELWDVAVEGDYAFAAAGSAGLVVVDLTATPPCIVCSVPVADYATSISVSGNYAYLGAGQLEVFDISDPENPVFLGSLHDSAGGGRQLIEGNRLYTWGIIGSKYIYIYELDGLGGIERVGSYYVEHYNALDVKAVGYTLYVAGGKAGFLILNATDPLHVELLAEFDPDDDYNGDFQAYRVALRDDMVALAINAQMLMLDVSDPMDIQVLGTSRYPALDLCFVDDMVFSITGPYGLRCIDLSSPDFPQKSGAGISDYALRMDLTQDQSTAVVGTHMDGLQLVDITSTGGLVDDFDAGRSRAGGGCAVGHFVYMTGLSAYFGGSFRPPGLYAVDLASAAPATFEDVPSRGVPTEVELYGNLVIVSDSNAGIMVVDISSPDRPVEIGSFDFDGPVLDTATREGVAYAACDYDGILALDLSEPAEPRELWRLPLPDDAKSLEMVGDHLYIASDTAGVNVVDVTDPENPVLVATVDTPGLARDVCFHGNTAYVADADCGLAVLDITDPASPAYVKSVDLPGFAWKVNYCADYVYVGCDDAGVQVLSVGDPLDPALHCSADDYSPVYEALPIGSRVLAFGEYGLVAYIMQ